MDILDFSDPLTGPNIDATLWGNHTWDDYNHEISGNVHHFTGHSDNFYPQVDVDIPEQGQGIQGRVDFPYTGPIWTFKLGNSIHYVEVILADGMASGYVSVQSAPGVWGSAINTQYGAYRHFRVYRGYDDWIRADVSIDGETWVPVVADGNGYDNGSKWSGYGPGQEFGGNVDVYPMAGVTVPPPGPSGPEVPDHFDPDATVPAVDPGCSTLLDQLRQFSAAVRRPFRITGPNEITMVDLNAEGLPDGMSWNEDNLYVEADYSEQAGIDVLRLSEGKIARTGAARLKDDDVRLLGKHQTPQILPTFNGEPATPVSRVTRTFTPRGYSESLEFGFIPEELEDDE